MAARHASAAGGDADYRIPQQRLIDGIPAVYGGVPMMRRDLLMELQARTHRPELLTDVAQHVVTRNRLLGRLPENEMVRLMPLFERIEITPRQILHHWNLPMDHVYFVESGLVSVMAKTSDRDWVEVWLIGSDGMTGIPIVLGDTHPPHRRVVHIGGSALRISTQVFRHLLQVSEPLSRDPAQLCRSSIAADLPIRRVQRSAYREATTCTLVAPRTRHTGVRPDASATRDAGTIDWGEASNNYRLSKRL